MASRDAAAPEAASAAIVRGAAVALLGSVLGGGLGFLFLVVMARLMDQRDFGLLVLAVTLLTAVAALGLVGADYAAVRFVSAARDPAAKRGAIVTPLALAGAVNLAVAALVLVFAGPIASRLLGQPGFADELRLLALALPLTTAAQLLSACVSGLERASGELVRKVAEQGGRIVLSPLGLVVGLGVAGAVLGLAVAAGLAVLVVGALLARALPPGKAGPRVPLRTVVSFAWPQTVANVSRRVWDLVEIVLLTHAAGARGVALYGAAVALGRLPALVYNSFAYRFAPAVARLWETGERAELQSLLKSVTRWVAIFAVPLHAVAIAIPASLLLVYGSDFAPAATALVLIALASLVNSLFGPVETALIMTGRVRLEMAANVVTTVVVTAAAFVVIPRYEVVGAAALTLAYAVLLNGLKLFFVQTRLGLTTQSVSLLGPLAAGAVAVAATASLDALTSLRESLPGIALLGLTLLAVYAAVYLGIIGPAPQDRAVLRAALRRGATAP